jgi:hypothetical protein
MPETGYENWIGDRFFSGSRPSEEVSMKPLLSAALDEAFHIAVVDSIPDLTDERRIAIFRNLHCMTDEEWGRIDPGALRRNIACRLWGSGGWTVRGVYSGNANKREVFEACIANTEANQIDDVVGALRGSGLDAKPISSPDDLASGG